MEILILFALFSSCLAFTMEDSLRNFYMPFAAAAYSDNPNTCLSSIQKWFDGVEDDPSGIISVYRQYKIECPSLNDICSGYTTFVNTNEESTAGPITIVFKGPTDSDYFYSSDWNYTEMVPFVGGGKVSKQLLDAFNIIWISAGMKDDILTLKNKSPGSAFNIIGHSSGGAMASLAAMTMAFSGVTDALNIGLFTFGQPRTGDKGYANAVISAGFWKSIRVVHNADIVPHLPSLNDTNYYQHVSEWWWPNNMTDGDNSIQCNPDNGEDPKCSDSLDVSKLNFDDHKVYFGRSFNEYGTNGCPGLNPPKNTAVKANQKRMNASHLDSIRNSSRFISPLGTVYTKEAKNRL